MTEKRILHVEDVEGNDFEFELELPTETWNDFGRLVTIGQHLLLEQHDNDNQISTLEVLTLN